MVLTYREGWWIFSIMITTLKLLFIWHWTLIQWASSLVCLTSVSWYSFWVPSQAWIDLILWPVITRRMEDFSCSEESIRATLPVKGSIALIRPMNSRFWSAFISTIFPISSFAFRTDWAKVIPFIFQGECLWKIENRVQKHGKNIQLGWREWSQSVLIEWFNRLWKIFDCAAVKIIFVFEFICQLFLMIVH